MEKSSKKSDDGKTEKKINDAAGLAKVFWDEGKRIKALKLTEKTISDHGKHELCFGHHELQGDIFFDQALKTDITDIKCVYLFASVDAYSMATLLAPNALRSFRGYARSLIDLGDQLVLNKFYEKAVSKAKPGLSVTQPRGQSTEVDYFGKMKTKFQELIDLATEKMHATVNVSDTGTMAIQMINKELGKVDPSFNRLKNIWVKLDDKTKREFLVVDFEKLIDYIKDKHGTEVKEHFQKCVLIAANNLRWRCWKCHICSQVNYCFTDCKMHILDNHVQKYEPEFSARPKYVDGVLADMICCGDWKPVDTAKAATLIMDRTKRREEFVYVNGWCSDWPVAEDEERENILKQFAEVLKPSCPKENRTLSCSLWKWLINYKDEHLGLPGVPGSSLDKCSFFKNPQCICFLDLKHLEHILKYFRQLTTDVRASLVLKVVNQLWENSQVKEIIDLEGVTTYNLLLDKTLLYEEVKHELDKTWTVEHYKSTGIYEDVKPKGDKIVSWILDCPEINREFMSQMANGIHNLEIWLATLRIVQCVAWKKVSYYDKRHKMLMYDKMLGEVETICDREDNRKNLNQWRRYASTLRVKCEELVGKQDDDTKCFLNVVRDVLESQKSPTLEVLEDKEMKECICRLSSTVENNVVKASLGRLRKSLKEKDKLKKMMKINSNSDAAPLLKENKKRHLSNEG